MKSIIIKQIPPVISIFQSGALVPQIKMKSTWNSLFSEFRVITEYLGVANRGWAVARIVVVHINKI